VHPKSGPIERAPFGVITPKSDSGGEERRSEDNGDIGVGAGGEDCARCLVCGSGYRGGLSDDREQPAFFRIAASSAFPMNEDLG
jgi:hypothetical protein